MLVRTRTGWVLPNKATVIILYTILDNVYLLLSCQYQILQKAIINPKIQDVKLCKRDESFFCQLQEN